MFKNLKKIANKVGIPTSSASFIVSKVDIVHMLDGRIRVVYKDLKKDEKLRNEVREKLSSIKEITEFKINEVTGSVLIVYDVDKAHNNKFLEEFLNLAKAKYYKE